MIHCYTASSIDDFAAARLLFNEYAGSLSINLEFQQFGKELESLEDMYHSNNGGIILAKEDDEFVGCVGIRRIDSTIAELKRMYVKPTHQQKGIGKLLLNLGLQLAVNCGYKQLRLDTLNYMLPAINLYKKTGFYEIAPYYANPNQTAVYFEKIL